MSLLDDLRALKPELPEAECYVPEWGRSITLRGFTVLEGRKLRKGVGKDGEQDNEELAIKTIAHAIADGEERPLANKDGIALIESLSELSVRKLMTAFAKVSTDDDVEGNSEARAGGDGSSSDSPSLSDARSPSSNGASVNKS